MENSVAELKLRLQEISRLESITSILSWDQSTYMPEGAAEQRGLAMAALSKAIQTQKTSGELGRLLDRLDKACASLSFKDQALVRIGRREFEEATKVPSSFHERLAAHTGLSYTTWVRAKKENNFSLVVDLLKTSIDLSREYSQYFKSSHMADPLINRADYGVSAAWLAPFFEELRSKLVPLVDRFADGKALTGGCLHGHFPAKEQIAFGEDLIRGIGYDFNRGRQDISHHPFMSRFNGKDVRITTRVEESFLGEALFSTIHEAGHALYEQGIDADLDETPLGCGTSSAVHESQSRLWENVVGRSHAFWVFAYPKLQKAFPEQLGSTSFEEFYCAINRVERSLIRTDADEVTYNLHILIRTKLEFELLAGTLRVEQLPEAWDELYRSDLKVMPSKVSEGVLQDIHWFVELVGGMFQGYTLGNVLSVQFFEAAKRVHPSLEKDVASGDFAALRSFLATNIYSFGRCYDTFDLVKKVTGEEISCMPYINYLEKKHSDVEAMKARLLPM